MIDLSILRVEKKEQSLVEGSNDGCITFTETRDDRRIQTQNETREVELCRYRKEQAHMEEIYKMAA